MTHYDVRYDDPAVSQEEHDAKAVQDIKDYLGRDAVFEFLVTEAKKIEAGIGPESVRSLVFAFHMVDVQGRPVHAFCRKYCLTKFVEWRRSGPDGEPTTGDDGFVRTETSVKET